jgi:hypothetical protein
MTKREMFESNLVLTTELSRYVLEHPEVAERIPKDAIVVILPDYGKRLAAENLKAAKANPGKKSADGFGKSQAHRGIGACLSLSRTRKSHGSPLKP